MATFGEKTEGSQTACEYMDYLVKLEKARKITLFLNGDKNFFGAQMLVNKRHFRTWDAFLNASTEKTGVNSAVRFITTPVNGTRLDGLDDLQDKESYVAITRGQFKPIGYTCLSDRYKQYSSDNIHSTSSILKIRPVEHSRIQVPGKIGQIPIHAMMINVFLNGKDFDAPFRIALSQKVQRKWELVMREIGEHVIGIMGRPKALYTVDGSKVITNSSDLEPGGTYVIVGSEPGGFLHYCYGCQGKAKHPKKLPPIKKKRRRPKKIVEKEVSSFHVAQPAEGIVEGVSGGDHEAQQDNKEFASVATSQGDLPLDTTFKQPDDFPLNAESSTVKCTLVRQSSSTPKATSPVERTASGQIEKVSSSAVKVAEKTQSAVFYSAEEQLNYGGPAQIIAEGSVEDSQITEKVADVIEQSYPLQATNTEEETEHEMEEETEQKLEEEAEKIVEIEPEKDMGGEQDDQSFEQAIASSNTAGLVFEMQQNSEKDELNHEDIKNSEHSATHQFHAEDPSATNSEVAAQVLWTREVDSGGQSDQGAGDPNQESTYVQTAKEGDNVLTENKDDLAADGNTNEFLLDDKAQSETNADVKVETKDSTPAAIDTNDSAASEQAERNVQSAKGSDKTITENKDEPTADRDTNEFLPDDKPQSKTNAGIEEEAKDHSEQDPAPAAMDTNDSDASEQAKRISSGALVTADFSKISTPLSTSEVPVAKDPSELNTTQKSSSKTDIQPHR